MDKSIRIKTNIGSDKVVRVNLRQDIDTFDILSMSIDANGGGYTKFSANYGVVVGRVIGNGGIGIPNAKVSVFIPLSETDELRSDIQAIYPYKSITNRDSRGRRYNLLPATYHDNEHVAVGSFPTPQMVLDNDIYLEVFEKYYKLSTVTNNSGDYMICNVPVGTQMLHMDVDISDIGYLSQKPYDLMYKGYDKSMFESASKFMGGTNIDLLPQIFTENSSIYVYPFWGDEETEEIAITRKDFELQYDFQPTAIFMGGSFSDARSNYISSQCRVAEKCGDASQLVPSEGSVSMMRETFDGSLEEVELNSARQIDGNGVWCFQVPMNLDYITTNEEGEIVRTNDPTKGIPTRARVRFKIDLEGEEEFAGGGHSMSYFIPCNPTLEDIHTTCSREEAEQKIRRYTYWGNNPLIADETFRKECMRDILWNGIYSVKNYIPRIQAMETDASLDEVRGADHVGIKGVNKKNAATLNPLPYNKINLGVQYGVWNSWQGSLISFLFWNKFDKKELMGDSWLGRYSSIFFISRRFLYPYKTYESIASEDEMFAKNLEENDGISFDFYNDWINGSLYFPKVSFDTSDNGPLCLSNSGTSINNIFLNDTCCLDYTSSGSLTGLSKTAIDSQYNIFTVPNWNHVVIGKDGVNNFANHSACVFLKNGCMYINSGTTDENNLTYSYTPLLLGKVDGSESVKLYPGFMTDLILLGSVDDYNVLGIPSIKNMRLPRSTSNIVSIFKADAPFDETKTTESQDIIKEKYVDLTSDNGGEEYEMGEMERDLIGATTVENPYSGRTVTLYGGRPYRVNGAFWGSAEYTPWINPDRNTYRWRRWYWFNRHPSTISAKDYFTNTGSGSDNKVHTLLGQGLFFGKNAHSMFSMLYVTKPKTCVNLSRICELSVVNEDSLAHLGSNTYGWWTNADTIGIITDDQITTPVGRTLFASLNNNRLNVASDSTSVFPTYNFEYMEINGFDGSLNGQVLKVGGPNLQETTCEKYIEFRYGKTSEKRFNTQTDDGYRFPVAKNSFYFYFGLSETNSALDVLKTKFFE